MATFNLLSSCICRDAFGFREDNTHKVLTFLQCTSPLTWFKYNDKPARMLVDEDFAETNYSAFKKKCVLNDFNKTAFDVFNEKADFFITDLVYFASTNLAKYTNPDGYVHYHTYSSWFIDAYNSGLKKVLPGTFESVNRLDLATDEVIEETVEKYIEWILSKGYKPEDIILVENKKIYEYSDGEIYYFFNKEKVRNRVNNKLDKVNACFKRKLPNCNVVKMPFNVYSPLDHKWGVSDFHFCYEYYDYLYECFDLIASNKNCQHMLEELRDSYSVMLQKKKEQFYKNAVNYMEFHQKNLVADKIGYNKTAERIALPGASCYTDCSGQEEYTCLTKYSRVQDYNREFSSIKINDTTYYVKNDDCLYGFIGNGKLTEDNWKTINSTTLVLLNHNSITIGHNGLTKNSQMQVVKTIDNTENLAGKTVTFSVWARVLQLSDSEAGGTIGIINADSYNNGKFFSSISFTNSEWTEIICKVKLPEKQKFNGLTLCMRANAGKNTDEPTHAIVEFSDPKLTLEVPKGVKNANTLVVQFE